MQQIYYIERKFYCRFFPKFKATSCSTYWSYDHTKLWIYGLFYLNLLNSNTHICDFEITQNFRSSSIVDLVAATLDLPVLMVWEWFPVVPFNGKGTTSFRSQKRSFKVSSKRALEFPLNIYWNRFETLIT